MLARRYLQVYESNISLERPPRGRRKTSVLPEDNIPKRCSAAQFRRRDAFWRTALLRAEMHPVNDKFTLQVAQIDGMFVLVDFGNIVKTHFYLLAFGRNLRKLLINVNQSFGAVWNTQSVFILGPVRSTTGTLKPLTFFNVSFHNWFVETTL